jgi:hypothetical protein
MFLDRGSRQLLDVEITGFHGRRTLGGHALDIFAKVTTTATLAGEDPAWIRGLSINVFLKGLFVGTAAPDVSIRYCRRQYPSSHTVTFRLALTGNAVEAIEKHRLGHDLDLELVIVAENGDALESRRDEERKSQHINQKAWLDCLQGMGYGDYVLWEFPIAMEPSEMSSSFRDLIERAKKHILQGHYSDAVSACRQVMEKLGANYKGKSKAVDKNDMTKAERVTACFQSLKHLMHLSVHPEKDGVDAFKDVEFSRGEAIMLLGTTVAFLSRHQARY